MGQPWTQEQRCRQDQEQVLQGKDARNLPGAGALRAQRRHLRSGVVNDKGGEHGQRIQHQGQGLGSEQPERHSQAGQPHQGIIQDSEQPGVGRGALGCRLCLEVGQVRMKRLGRSWAEATDIQGDAPGDLVRKNRTAEIALHRFRGDDQRQRQGIGLKVICAGDDGKGA